MSELLHRYGFIVDDTDVIDTLTIPNHTILYQKRDGLWMAYLERWINGDPSNFTVICTSAKQDNIHECSLEIKEGFQ